MPVREITIIDLWTDANRGDNALQVSLIEMLRRHHPDAVITGVFRFGTNEFAAARPEIAETGKALDVAIGGLRRTYYAEANAGRFPGLSHMAVSLLSFLEASIVVACYRLAPRASRRVIGAHRHRSLGAVRDADLVVWKGKNFRDYRGLTAISRALTLCGAGYFASLLRPRIECVNASFWPIEQPVQRWIYRRAFRRCRSITVRDPSSLDNGRDLLGGAVRLRLCADLSFPLLAGAATAPSELPSPSAGWDVALTVTSWGTATDQDHYVDSLTAACRRLHALGATRFVIVPQVTRAAEDSSSLVEALNRRLVELPASVDVVGGSPSIGELLDVYVQCRMLIGSRMHSCIFARSVGVPFVAVSYDTGPKWETLTAFWDPTLVVTYDSGARELATACERVWTEGPELIDASSSAWADCVASADENVTWLDG